jgi:hypothetical protein
MRGRAALKAMLPEMWARSRAACTRIGGARLLACIRLVIAVASPSRISYLITTGAWYPLRDLAHRRAKAVEAVRSAAQEFAAVEAPLREYSDVPRAHTTSTSPV